MSVDMKAVFSKLNAATREVLDNAIGLCVANTHYNLDIEHYLAKLAETTDTDFARVAKHFGLDVSRFVRELTSSLDRQKRGNSGRPAIGPPG
ncbi:MAG: Clp protease N-terminal domain-containing protein [Bryobacteraceae bacterium]